MASLVQLSEAIETGKLRLSGDVNPTDFTDVNGGQPDFNHKNPADWLLKRSQQLDRSSVGANNAEYIRLLRKCE